MNTPLDTTPAWLWFPESAEFSDGTFSLVLVVGKVSQNTADLQVLPESILTGLRNITIPENTKRVLVQFHDVKLLHVIAEAAYREDPEETREPYALAQHRNSALLRYVRESTLLSEIIPGQLLHFSVATAEDYYHVVSRLPPSATEIEA